MIIRRALARITDTSLAMIFLLPLTSIGTSYVVGNISYIKQGGFSFLVALLVSLAQAISLTFVGTTPGKKLFGVCIEKKGFGANLWRELKAFFLGCGAFYLVLMPFTLLLQAIFVKIKGRTSYDPPDRLSLQGISVLRWIVAVMTAIALMAVAAFVVVFLFAALNVKL